MREFLIYFYYFNPKDPEGSPAMRGVLLNATDVLEALRQFDEVAVSHVPTGWILHRSAFVAEYECSPQAWAEAMTLDELRSTG